MQDLEDSESCSTVATDGHSPKNSIRTSDVRPGPGVHLADLEQLVERMECAQAAAGIGIHDYDIVNDSIEWDMRVRNLWGVSADEPVNYATFASGVHPDDLPDVETAVAKAFAPEGDGTYLAEYRVTNRIDGKTRIVAATGQTIFENGEAVRLVGTVRDVTQKRLNELALEEAQRFAQSLVETAPTLLYIYDLNERRNIYIGPQILPMLGYDQTQIAAHGSDLFAALFHPDDIARISRHHERLAADIADVPRELEYRVLHSDGSWRWVISKDRVYKRDAAGKAMQILGAALDVTERRRAQEQRELLVGELSHRVKNALAVVQSIAAMTLKPNCDPAAWEQFEHRLIAMARAQNLLADNTWEAANLKDVAEATIDAFSAIDRGRVSIEGPSVMINANDSMALSMVFHELTTNAMKYGALMSDKGTVSIWWAATGDKVSLEWAEQGGPTVRKPDKRGFGSTLISRALSSEDCKTTCHYEPSGFRCQIELRSFSSTF